MTPPLLSQLELILKQLVHGYRLLLEAVNAHETALRSRDIEQIERATAEQDQLRQKIAAIETKRRMLTHQLARQLKLAKPPTLAQLAEAFPEKKALLLQMRTDLASIAATIQTKTQLISRIAQSVLGHVSATLRLVANATHGPGVYTKNGTASMPMRIGVLNAVA
jgi:hypothetical protein